MIGDARMGGPLTRGLLNSVVQSMVREHDAARPVHVVVVGPEGGQHEVYREEFRAVGAGYVRRVVKSEVQRMFEYGVC